MAKHLLGDNGFGFTYYRSVIKATEIYYVVFGALALLGGIVGYAKAKGLASLLTGVLFGLALVVAGFLHIYGEESVKTLGLILGLLATAGLSGIYVPKIMMNRAAPQVIIMAVLSGIGLVLTLILFAGK